MYRQRPPLVFSEHIKRKGGVEKVKKNEVGGKTRKKERPQNRVTERPCEQITGSIKKQRNHGGEKTLGNRRVLPGRKRQKPETVEGGAA